jgi:hypothetical protein
MKKVRTENQEEKNRYVSVFGSNIKTVKWINFVRLMIKFIIDRF